MDRVYNVLLKSILISIILIVIEVIPVLATHQLEHRFTIYGYVYDEGGTPLSRTKVEIRNEIDQLLGTVKTNTNGSYKILLHLHNESLGDRLIVTANGMDKKIIVRFDPDDLRTERKTEVNFGSVPETVKKSDRTVIVGVISLVVLVGGVYIILARRKKRREMTRRKRRRRKKKR